MQGVVLLADVEGSRRSPDRQAWSEHLQAQLRALNRHFRADLLGGFDIQKGTDEFGALLKPAGRIGEALLEVIELLHPQRVRFALVAGNVDVSPPTSSRLPSSRLFDGPVFHDAAALMGDGHRRQRLVSIRLATSPWRNALLETSLSLYALQVYAATPRQLEAFRLYRDTGSQEAVAEELDVSQPSVSQTLKRIDARFLAEAHRTLIHSLNDSSKGNGNHD